MCMGVLSGEANAGKVTVATPDGSRTYTLYGQMKTKRSKNYFRRYGCITVGVSIAASGFGVDVNPWTIHLAKATQPYSERYAVSQLQQKFKEQAISLRLASQILTNMGIPNKAVATYAPAQAEAEIRQHLQAGKPVIVKVRKKRYAGIQFTNHHHALVLIGLNGDNVVFVNTANGRINDSRVGKVKSKIILPLHTLVTKFMFSSKGNTAKAYVRKDKAGGGYILVG